MNGCGEWAWFHPDRGHSRFFCGSGSCWRPQCRNLFWSRRVRLLSALIAEYGLIRFFTLTLDPGFIEGDPWVYVHHPWSKMRKRLKRVKPGFRFVAVLERHKHRNVPHIHGFTDLWLEQQQWSQHWQQSRGGKVVWVEQVKSSDASVYVSKELQVARYVGKECLVPSYHVSKRYRTLWRSKDTKAEYELTREPGWCIIKQRMYGEDGEPSDFAAKRGVWSYGEAQCGR